MTLWRMALTPAMATLLEGSFARDAGRSARNLEQGLSESEGPKPNAA